MDIELFLKFIGSLASVFALYKLIVDVVLAKSIRRRDEYEFTKKFLEDLKNKETHPYIIEKGFFALSGKTYSIDEIKHLLNKGSPSFEISQRNESNHFIEFDREANAYKWKQFYSKPFIKKHGVSLYMGLYIVTCSVAITPVYIKGLSTLSNSSIMSFCLSFLYIAVLSLFRHENLKIAKKFIQTQSQS
ncbi:MULTISPECIES: hypothetical protein [unclassified Endozoicomonas]|uniref:hypothetical protein n=1 Tax=unclassified Endozoicomonas TaxID=2644528 RepID=UPI003BB492C3